jgi:aspartyl-tRNA(Asn)/glutamyl-tRNA(Gln) amidotransferase subunit A
VTTIPANIACIPGMSIPMGLAPEDGLPTGLQIMAPARADDRLYRLGAYLERVLEEQWGGPLLSKAPALV